MTTVSILPEPPSATETKYRAVAGQRQFVGKTPGEALDLLTSQLTDQESGTLIVVQHMRPDRFFSDVQQKRLADLMNRWRSARDSGNALPPDERAELEQLIATELEASAQRASALLSGLKP